MAVEKNAGKDVVDMLLLAIVNARDSMASVDARDKVHYASLNVGVCLFAW